MKSDNDPEEPVIPAHTLKPDKTLVSEMLTPSEIEQLQQEKKEHNAYAKKAFSRLRPK